MRVQTNGCPRTRRKGKRHRPEHLTYVLPRRSDHRFSPLHVDYRKQLNNWFQVNGGSGRLDWASSRTELENNPFWTAIGLGTSPVNRLLSFWLIGLNGVDRAQHSLGGKRKRPTECSEPFGSRMWLIRVDSLAADRTNRPVQPSAHSLPVLPP